ncbi:hypothetical protein M6B22_14325 [Jatrophihabitans cynanchi]|jgi:hypothetical protein|uniref:DUF4304 domain-containing protein n=1 Tax=Jatrophihabitans cynanchi TaxID=2944128 RepID=A0ABY7JVJ9_9ACTN|nr:hypothetical protein [Jatrophihabitans sp. SB3-54]WAX55708.1 hypothetical protein M6B22_14325 [Jatrophihabitans sp. SB3-54]
MKHIIDRHAAADEIRSRLDSWRAKGFVVDPVTWADGQTTVNPITTDRNAVRGDYSVGVKARRDGAEAQVVLYSGGWCDLSFWSGNPEDDPVDEAPGWEDRLDLEGFARVLDRFERTLLGSFRSSQESTTPLPATAALGGMCGRCSGATSQRSSAVIGTCG